MVERGSLRGLCDQPPISEMRESPLRSGARRLAVHRADSNGSLRHCSGQHRTMPSGSAASARLCNGSTTAPLHVRRGGAEGTPVFAALRAVRAGLRGSRWRFPIFIKETGCVGAVVVNALSQLEDHRLVTEAIRETISRLFASVPQKNAGRAALPLGRRSSQLCEMTGGVLASL